MLLAKRFLALSHGRSGRSVLKRRRQLSVESLEGRTLLTLDFTTALDIPGNETVFVNDIALNGDGDTIVAGSFQGDASFDPAASPIGSGTENDVGFVASYSSANKLLWVTEFKVAAFSSSGEATVNGIAVDRSSGEIYVAGTFSGKIVDIQRFEGTSSVHLPADHSERHGGIRRLRGQADERRHGRHRAAQVFRRQNR